MKTYIFTSDKFTGEIEYRFNERDLLVGFDIRAQFSNEQYSWTYANMPVTSLDMHDLTIKVPCSKFVEIKVELTFAQFWKQYFAGRGKDNSSKKRAEAKWNRMSHGEQAKAYAYINKYMSKISYGTQPKYAETYLNSELWNE